jgi:hypothetical protein
MTTIPPLLMIAEGRKPRPRKAPIVRPREIELHMSVVKLLQDFSSPGWIWSHFPAGEKRDIRTAAKLKRMGVKAGWPDFLLISPAGIFHGLELKRPGGVMSEAQEDFLRWAIANGINHSVADNVDDAIAVLSHWGAVKIAVAGMSREGGR